MCVGNITVCYKSLDPFYIVTLLHKIGQHFLDIENKKFIRDALISFVFKNVRTTALVTITIKIFLFLTLNIQTIL